MSVHLIKYRNGQYWTRFISGYFITCPYTKISFRSFTLDIVLARGLMKSCVCITLTQIVWSRIFGIFIFNRSLHNQIKPDNLSLFIKRNSKHCDISGRSDRLITDTFFTVPPRRKQSAIRDFSEHFGIEWLTNLSKEGG